MSEYVEYEKDKKYIDYWIREVLSSSDLLSGYSFSTEDLKQRAWLELLRASEKYDPAQGVKLMTYAKKAVERGIKEEAVFQINIEAFESRKQRKLVKTLVKDGYPYIFGSDAHNMDSRKPNWDLLKTRAKPDVIAGAEVLV